MSLLERITIDPEVVHGRPAVRGTRMRVADVLSLLAAGASEAEILKDYPYRGRHQGLSRIRDSPGRPRCRDRFVGAVRFLIDAQLPPALAQLLISRAHLAEHVNDVGLGESPDRDLWRYALEHGAVIVTEDEDFANMAALGGDAPTVVWVPVGNTRRAALLAWFEPLIDEVVSPWSRRAIGSSSCAEPTARLRPNLLGSPLPLPVAWLRVSVLPPCSDRRTSREPDQKTDSRCSVQEMTLGTLIKGLALLLLLLIATGQLGNLGPVELLMWLSLVVSWITWWVTRRARARATP